MADYTVYTWSLAGLMMCASLSHTLPQWWFLTTRRRVFLALVIAMAPIALAASIPAWEVVSFFLVQIAFTALAALLRSFFPDRLTIVPANTAVWRAVLLGVLAVILLIAMGNTVDHFDPMCILSGGATAWAFFAGATIALERPIARRPMVVAMTFAFLAAVPLALYDKSLLVWEWIDDFGTSSRSSIVTQWITTFFPGLGRSTTDPVATPWIAVIPSLTIIGFLAVSLAARRWAIPRTTASLPSIHLGSPRWSGPTLVLFYALSTLPCLAAFVAICATPTIPPTSAQNLACYDTLVQLGKQLQTSDILDSLDVPRLELLSSEVHQHDATFSALHMALTDPECAHCCSESDSFDTNDIMTLHAISRAIHYATMVARNEQQPDRVAAFVTDSFYLANAIARKGLLVEWLVGRKPEGFALRQLRSVSDTLSQDQMRQLLADVITISAQFPTIEEAIARDKLWATNQFGWVSRLVMVLRRLHEGELHDWDSYAENGLRRAVDQRIVFIEVALDLFQRDTGHLPLQLDELAVLPTEVLVDPYNRDRGQFRYDRDERDDQGYRLYSVGPNQRDDGGNHEPTHASDPTDDLTASILFPE